MEKIMDAGHMEYQNNDFKYFMQDVGNLYLGARYNYAELMAHEMVPFKLKSIIEHYIMKDEQIENETSLESHFYYITPDMFSYKTYMQLKVKVKVCLLAEKKPIFGFGKEKVVYQNQVIALDKFAQMNLARKKSQGVKIQEIVFPKLAMMSFSV